MRRLNGRRRCRGRTWSWLDPRSIRPAPCPAGSWRFVLPATGTGRALRQAASAYSLQEFLDLAHGRLSRGPNLCLGGPCRMLGGFGALNPRRVHGLVIGIDQIDVRSAPPALSQRAFKRPCLPIADSLQDRLAGRVSGAAGTIRTAADKLALQLLPLQRADGLEHGLTMRPALLTGRMLDRAHLRDLRAEVGIDRTVLPGFGGFHRRPPLGRPLDRRIGRAPQAPDDVAYLHGAAVLLVDVHLRHLAANLLPELGDRARPMPLAVLIDVEGEIAVHGVRLCENIRPDCLMLCGAYRTTSDPSTAH